MCKPTGVTLSLGRRVLIMSDTQKGNAGHALREHLGALGVEVLFINDAPDADTFNGRLNTWLASGPIHGVYWLPALDNEGDLSVMSSDTWHEAVHVRLKLLYHAMRTLYDQISAPGAFLVSATRLGGQHGYDAAGATSPLGGAVTGFTKAYKRERIDALVKAIDFGPAATAAEIADRLIAETLTDSGAVEVGYK